MRFLVPELDALYYSVAAPQIQRAGLATGVDSLPKLQLFILAISKVHHDALKIDGGISDPNLELMKCPFRLADGNLVMI